MPVYLVIGVILGAEPPFVGAEPMKVSKP